MTREFRLMLAEQGAADPELAGCDVHRPADPRDAEIERLRAALVGLNGHIETMQRQVTQYLTPGGDGPDHLINAIIYMLDGPGQRAVQQAGRAALAQCGEAV